MYQKFEKFCSGFITDKHRERYERDNKEVERMYLGDDIEDVGAPADVWEEQEDVLNKYYRSERLSVLCLIWEDYSFWEALRMMLSRVLYRWTLFRDTVFDRFLPKSAIFSCSKVLCYASFYILLLLGAIIILDEQYYLDKVPYCLNSSCFSVGDDVLCSTTRGL